MKTNKMIAAGLAASAIVMLSMSSVSAMNWQWQGQWGWQGFWKTLSTEQKTELQTMNESEKQEYINKLKTENWITSWKSSKWSSVEHNPWDLLSWIALQDLSDAEKEMLFYWYRIFVIGLIRRL